MGFAEAARAISRAVGHAGWQAPSFRCPPGLVGVDRSIRRRRVGSPVIAVRIKHRPWVAVLADMIEGAVVSNQLVPPDADRARNLLWEAVGMGSHGDLGGEHRAA